MKTLPELLVEAVDYFTPDSESATVTLRSNVGVIQAFCHPCSLQAGDYVKNELSAWVDELRAAYLIDWPDELKTELATESLQQLDDYAYRGCANVLDLANGLIVVNGFCFDVGEIPFNGTLEFEFSKVILHDR